MAISGQRVAVRNSGTLNYLLNDHLGGTNVSLNKLGTVTSELRYSAWGETRYTSGTTPTDRQYTGQINDGATGLYYYNARYYDPALHKFIQADTIVPDPTDPQTLNRFSYTNNNPIKYTDPTGHWPTMADEGGGMGLLVTAWVASSALYVTQQAMDASGGSSYNFDIDVPDFSLPVSNTPPLELPTSTGSPAPVAPPFSNDYSSVAAPRMEFPLIQTATTSVVFGEGFTDEETNFIMDIVNGVAATGKDVEDVTFWRSEGAPPQYDANASVTGERWITIHDSFFTRYTREELIKILIHEMAHFGQAEQVLRDGISSESASELERDAGRYDD